MKQRSSRLAPALCVAAWALHTIPGHVGAAEEALNCVIEPRSTIALGSAEEGILAELLVARGDRVKKGEPVARLDTALEQLTAELARLQAETDVEVRSHRAQFNFRSKEHNRLKALRADKAVTEKDYEQALVERRLAQLALEAAETEHSVAQVEYQRAKARLDRRTIHSPVDGAVVDVDMSPGEYVHEQATLMRIAEIHPLNVEVFVPVRRYGTIGAGTSAEVMPEPPIGGTYQAAVTVVDHVFDPASRTFGVRLELPNQDYALPAGLRCTVRFPKSTQTKEKADADLDLSLTK